MNTKMRWDIGTLILADKSTKNSPYGIIINHNDEEKTYTVSIHRPNQNEIIEVSEFGLEKWESEFGHRFFS